MNYTIVYDRPGRIRFRCGGYAFEKRQEGAVKNNLRLVQQSILYKYIAKTEAF